MPKALVAMSGGVDSAVAAALLLERGFEVVGCFMRLGEADEPAGLQLDDGACAADASGQGRRRGCCSVADAADARLVAATLGIPLYICNFQREFRRVMDYFVRECAAGRTPNPCVRCNDWLKFGRLFDHADALGADVVASGHHARVEQGPDGPRLLRGVDARKDQSYVLFGLPRRILARLALPIGELSKDRVRELARQLGLPVHDKPDSQEICFVPDGDHVRFVESRRPELRAAGAVVDLQGRVVGEHQGQHRFTLGQRRRLGVALGRPVYVVDKDPRTNTVVVGEQADLWMRTLEAGEVNWLAAPPAGPFRALAQVRAHSAAAPALVELDLQADELRVRFEAPQRPTAPGQAVVCYDAEDPARVLGGGWIRSVFREDRRCAALQAASDGVRSHCR